jgi:hypothetical protein
MRYVLLCGGLVCTDPCGYVAKCTWQRNPDDDDTYVSKHVGEAE